MTATRALYEQVSVPNDVSGPRLEKASHLPPPTQPARPLTEHSRSQRTGCGKLLSFASAADRRVNVRHTLQAWRHRAERYGTLQNRAQEKREENSARVFSSIQTARTAYKCSSRAFLALSTPGGGALVVLAPPCLTCHSTSLLDPGASLETTDGLGAPAPSGAPMNEPLADVPMKPPPRDLFILSRPRSKRQSYPSTVAHMP